MPGTLRQFLHRIRNTPAGIIINKPFTFAHGLGFLAPRLKDLVLMTARSREYTNFTYPLSRQNQAYAAHFTAVITGAPLAEAKRVIAEVLEDAALADFVRARTKSSREANSSDGSFYPGRRCIWYAFVRLTRPEVVVETGVEKGLGALVLCAALRRNADDGYPGYYYGTDINPQAGWLLGPPYSEFGRVLFGDSIASLEALEARIGVFVNDSDHSAEYEAAEYEVIFPKLTDAAIVVGDNAHVTDKLMRFSEAHGREFLFFREQPEAHWYPGGGVGISYRQTKAGPRP